MTTSDLQALIDYPLPTYVAGVDIEAEKVYIAAAFDKNLVTAVLYQLDITWKTTLLIMLLTLIAKQECY